MSANRRRGLSGPARYLPVLLLAVLTMASACVSAPKEAPEESPAAAEPKPDSAGDLRPEVVEIRGPVPLPTRMVLVLPDPEPKKATGMASRLPTPQTPPASGAVESVASADTLPAPPLSAVPAPAAEPPKPAPAPAEKPPETKAAAPTPPQKPAATAAVPKTSTAPEKPAAPAGSASPAKPPAAASAQVPAAPETAPKPALAPSPGSSTRTTPESVQAPGRTEEAVRGSPLELPLRGSGWVYLGETGGRDGLRYETRRFDGSQAVFLFTAERPGEYQLRFQRQDPFSGEPENLIVKVIVREPEPVAASGTSARLPAGSAAPAAALERPATATPPAGSAAPLAPAQPAPSASAPGPAQGPASAAAAAPAAAGSPASPAASLPPRELPSSPEELLRLAREDLAASRIAGVLEVLDRYMLLFPFGSDEAHYLYAKAYEQNTPYRDIKKAYANYRKVRDEWPRSVFWKEAAERVTYIERHYFDIR